MGINLIFLKFHTKLPIFLDKKVYVHFLLSYGCDFKYLFQIKYNTSLVGFKQKKNTNLYGQLDYQKIINIHPTESKYMINNDTNIHQKVKLP